MKITKQLLSPLALLFMLASARGQDIHYNYDRGANFQFYRTYQWVDLQRGPGDPSKADVSAVFPNLSVGPPPMGGTNVQDDQLLDRDIKRAVDEQLAQKGLTKVDKNADIQVSYQAAVHDEKGINLWGMGGTRALVAGPGWPGFDSVQGQTSTIPIGTLVMSLYDPARKQLIWRGDASKTIDLKKDPNKNYQTLQKAMAKLFKNYPPQPHK